MSKIEISRELLSKVLNIPKENIVDIYIDGNYLLIQKDNNRVEEHNIYEFTFKCKEWAINKGYQIISGLYDEPAYRSKAKKAYAKINHYYGDGFYNLKNKDNIIIANIEIEAVIKASEYVLKDIK